MKHSKVEACIICEDTPCSCYAKKKPVKKAQAPGAAVFPKPSQLQAKVDEIIGAPPVVRNWGKTASQPQPDMGLDFETAQAIRNLADAGLLTDATKAKYRDVIAPRATGDTDRRLADWRKRNDLA